ncbi:hypothetical protein [Thalassotalea eurytherma]|uniref:Transglutaminase domain-containing protein n=1 Tax=Thalassotalea eurytherma TaxID=1144278 RepID=A0ABQ6H4K4_9GAMM|nr:hypothetical protein [Thalassotalea eurytherma]GLX82100.1 hypothetical protein theurythT_15520 [Thalassotalea eurytherma]
MSPKISISFYIVIFSLAILLLSVNIVGIFMSIEPTNIQEENLRFHDDVNYTYQEAIPLLVWESEDNLISYSERVTHVISKRLAHIHWLQYDATKFNQLIPIWENYFLYLMGKFSTIPEYKRYHFADYDRSLYRGIGICGDASMIMSQLLSKNNIQNQIVTFPGHVIVETIGTKSNYTYDPDFGVVLPYSIKEINQSPNIIRPFYEDKGYSEKEIKNLVEKYGLQYKNWQSVKHFITKKYYFEKVTYWLKWPLPIILLLYSLFKLRRHFKLPVR